jgi:hypothetical protein
VRGGDLAAVAWLEAADTMWQLCPTLYSLWRLCPTESSILAGRPGTMCAPWSSCGKRLGLAQIFTARFQQVPARF